MMAPTAAEIQRKLAENAAAVNEQIVSSCCNSGAMVRWCDPRKVPALLDEIISYGRKSETKMGSNSVFLVENISCYGRD